MTPRLLAAAAQTLHRRLLNIAARAVVLLANDANKIQRLQVELLSGEIREPQRVQDYGFNSVPLEGAYPAIVLAPFGDRNQLVVIRADDVRHRPSGGEPGEVGLYDYRGNKVRLVAGGLSITSVSGLVVAISDDGGISIGGALEVNVAGDATLNVGGVAKIDCAQIELGAGTLQALCNEAFATLYAAHEHPNGGGGSPTGTPIVPPVPGVHTTVETTAA